MFWDSVLNFFRETKIGRFLTHIIFDVLIFIIFIIISCFLDGSYGDSAHNDGLWALIMFVSAGLDIICTFFYDLLGFDFMDGKFGVIFKNIIFGGCFLLTFLYYIIFYNTYLFEDLMLIPSVVLRGAYMGFQLSPILVLVFYQKISKDYDNEISCLFITPICTLGSIICGILLGLIFGWVPFTAIGIEILLTVAGFGYIIYDAFANGIAFDRNDEIGPLSEHIDFGKINTVFDRSEKSKPNALPKSKNTSQTRSNVNVEVSSNIDSNNNNNNNDKSENDPVNENNSDTVRKTSVKDCIKKIHFESQSICLELETTKHFQELGAYSVYVKVYTKYEKTLDRNGANIKICSKYFVEGVEGDDDYTKEYNKNKFGRELNVYIDDKIQSLENKLKSKAEHIISYMNCPETASVWSCSLSKGKISEVSRLVEVY